MPRILAILTVLVAGACTTAMNWRFSFQLGASVWDSYTWAIFSVALDITKLAAGVDDKTWLHHLAEGAYSRWFAEAIKDQELAAEASSVEKDAGLSAHDSRARIKELVDKRYTAPAKSE